MFVCERWGSKANCIILLFLDKNGSYNYIKDMQSCGAAIQNMLLATHDFGIGMCWVGSVVSSAQDINKWLNIGVEIELVGMVTLGYEAISLSKTIRNAYETFSL